MTIRQELAIHGVDAAWSLIIERMNADTVLLSGPPGYHVCRIRHRWLLLWYALRYGFLHIPPHHTSVLDSGLWKLFVDMNSSLTLKQPASPLHPHQKPPSAWHPTRHHGNPARLESTNTTPMVTRTLPPRMHQVHCTLLLFPTSTFLRLVHTIPC